MIRMFILPEDAGCWMRSFWRCSSDTRRDRASLISRLQGNCVSFYLRLLLGEKKPARDRRALSSRKRQPQQRTCIAVPHYLLRIIGSCQPPDKEIIPHPSGEFVDPPVQRRDGEQASEPRLPQQVVVLSLDDAPRGKMSRDQRVARPEPEEKILKSRGLPGVELSVPDRGPRQMKTA